MSLAESSRLALECALANPTAYQEIKETLEVIHGGVASASFTVNTEAANAITVNVQLKDSNGANLAQVAAVTILVLADAAGAAFNSTNYTTIAAGTDGALVETVADKVLMGISESDGDLDVVLTVTGAATSYLAVVLPGGKLSVSGAITHS